MVEKLGEMDEKTSNTMRETMLGALYRLDQNRDVPSYFVMCLRNVEKSGGKGTEQKKKIDSVFFFVWMKGGSGGGEGQSFFFCFSTIPKNKKELCCCV